MAEHQASRTLVKSPPELWAECSNAASLERHLCAFGEIRITTLEPETTVAWEGERARGTVRIEPSGWGTRVTLTARALADAAAVEDYEEYEAYGNQSAGANAGYNGTADTDSELSPLVEVSAPLVELRDPLAELADELADPPGTAAETARPRMLARVWGILWPRRRITTVIETQSQERLELGLPPAADRALQPADAADLQTAVDVKSRPAVDSEPQPAVETEPAPIPDVDAQATLTAALDSLGQAHHRPFSRP